MINIMLKVYKCRFDNFSTLTPSDYLNHIKVHDRMHIRPTSLIFFSYNKLKELNKINRYMTWNEFNKLFSLLDIRQRHALYIMWIKAIENTCAVNPCQECIQKKIMRNYDHKRMFKNNRELYDQIFGKGFTYSKSGIKVPLDSKLEW